MTSEVSCNGKTVGLLLKVAAFCRFKITAQSFVSVLVNKRALKTFRMHLPSGFRSVVVITFALHAKGPQFETGRKQAEVFLRHMLKWLSGKRMSTLQ